MADKPLFVFAAIGHFAPNDAAMARALRDVHPVLASEGVEALLVLSMGEWGARLVPLGDIGSGEQLARAVDRSILTAVTPPCEAVTFRGCDFFLSRRREVDLDEVEAFARCLSKAPKDRPFFVAQRRHPRGTVAGYWVPDQDAGRLGEILRGRHNAFVYSSGGYAPLADDHSVSQGDFGFTSVQVSSFRGARPPGGRITPPIGRRYRTGVITRVYEDRVAISRVALLTGETIGPDWVAPLGEYGALAYPRQAAAAGVPAWPERARMRAKGGETLSVTFPTAANPRAYEYLVTVKFREGGVEQIVAERRVFTSGIYGPVGSEPKRVTCDFARDELYHGVPLAVEVRALNSFGAAGEPLAATATLKV